MGQTDAETTRSSLRNSAESTIVPMVRLFLNVAALLIIIALIAPYDCIRNPCMLLGGESSEPSAHAQKSLCSGTVEYSIV